MTLDEKIELWRDLEAAIRGGVEHVKKLNRLAKMGQINFADEMEYREKTGEAWQQIIAILSKLDDN